MTNLTYGKNQGYSEQQLMGEDIVRLNTEEQERVKDTPNLYISLKEAHEGNTDNLERHITRKYSLVKNSLHVDIVFTDKSLRKLAERMKAKYADDEMVSNSSVNLGGQAFTATVDRKAFTADEIDTMMINFIYNFNKRIVEITEGLAVNVPSITSFKGENDTHSNNRLMSYIVGKNGKTGQLENALLQAMEIKKDSKRFVENGIEHKVNLNDAEVFSYEDISTYEDEEGEIMDIHDALGEEEKGYKKVEQDEDYDIYQPTKELKFIKENYKKVFTKNQLEKFKMLLEKIEKGKINIDDLFHPVTDKLILRRLGGVWYPGQSNGYMQRQVTSMLDSMRSRMAKAMLEAGFKDEDKVLKGTYRKLRNHSAKDNRLLSEYKIYEKYLIRDLHLDNHSKQLDVTFKNDEQFIPYYEYEKIQRNEQTVKDVINKYGLTKKDANNPNGKVKHYIIDEENGEALFTDEEVTERIYKHAMRLLDMIKHNYITFTPDAHKDGYMKASDDRLLSVTYDDYVELKKRKILTLNDEQVEIIKKYINPDRFFIGNKYTLTDEYYVDLQDSKYIDKKNLKLKRELTDFQIKNYGFLLNTGNEDFLRPDEEILMSYEDIKKLA